MDAKTQHTRAGKKFSFAGAPHGVNAVIGSGIFLLLQKFIKDLDLLLAVMLGITSYIC